MKYLHSMIRVGDPQATVRFFEDLDQQGYEPLLAKLSDQQKRSFGEQLFGISRALGSD